VRIVRHVIAHVESGCLSSHLSVANLILMPHAYWGHGTRRPNTTVTIDCLTCSFAGNAMVCRDDDYGLPVSTSYASASTFSSTRAYSGGWAGSRGEFAGK
jgi:hypothetical protein